MGETPDTYLDLFFGYSAIWAIVVVYLVNLARQQRALRRDINNLKQLLGARSEFESEMAAERKASRL